MHYKMGSLDFPITDEKEFMRLTGGEYAEGSELSLTKESLPVKTRVIALKFI